MRDAVRVDRFRGQQLHLLDVLVEPHIALRDIVDAARRVGPQDRVVVFFDGAVFLDDEEVDVALHRRGGEVVGYRVVVGMRGQRRAAHAQRREPCFGRPPWERAPRHA